MRKVKCEKHPLSQATIFYFCSPPYYYEKCTECYHEDWLQQKEWVEKFNSKSGAGKEGG